MSPWDRIQSCVSCCCNAALNLWITAALLYGRPSRFSDLAAHHGFLMLMPFSGREKSRRRAPVALLIMAAAVAAAATETLAPHIAFLAGAVAMVLTRCVDIERAYQEIDVRIFVMIGGVIPLGIAMEKTGTAALVADLLLNHAAHWSPLVLLLVMPTGFWGQLAAFGLFRLFDAAKPGPVRWADQLFKGQRGAPVSWAQGWGILFDDFVAAGCTLLVIALWRY